MNCFKESKMRVVALLLLVVSAFGCGPDKRIDPKQRVYVGYYKVDNTVKIDAKSFNKTGAFKPHIVAWSVDFSSAFPKKQVMAFQKMSVVPMLVWEPRIWTDAGAQISLADISGGKWDSYLKTWAAEMRSVELPLLVSFAPEMNSEDYPWGTPRNGQSGAAYVAAYRHVVSLLRDQGVSNVIFVWTILPTSSPNTPWNEPLLNYPGDEYVDWIGLAAVNQQSGLKVMFGDMLSNLATNHPEKPVMITRYYFEPSKKLNAEVVGDLQLEIPTVKALILSNPKTLKMEAEYFKQQLFQADVDEFAYLHF